VVKGDKKPKIKAPRIQRLITPQRLQRKRAEKAEHKRRYIKAKQEATDFNALVLKRFKEAKEKRNKAVAAKRSQSARPSQAATEAPKPVAAAPAAKVAAKAASKKEDKKEKKPAAKAAATAAPVAKPTAKKE